MPLSLPVNEIFYSLQGEGGQMGMPTTFIRLAGCNLACPYCDTDHKEGHQLSIEQIAEQIATFPAQHILFTGGEPTLYLKEEHLTFFHLKGYRISLETNGTRPIPQGFDYISCSPKPEAFHLLWKHFPDGVDEWRFPFGLDAPLPPPVEDLPPARHYYLSPLFALDSDGTALPADLEQCIAYILEHPSWQLSVQLHKLVGFR